jgi:streptomycin 6-kinase
VLDRAALAALGVDDALIATRCRLDGDRAIAFLASLPDLVAQRQREFGVTGARIMAGGALSAVLACTGIADARPVVLKLSVDDAHGAAAEAAALALWAGDGACALLAASSDGTALLLAAIEPGDAAAPSVDDGADARLAAALLARLRRERDDLPAAVPDAASRLDWRFGRARRFVDEGRALAAVTRAELDAAASAAAELHAGAARALCHGDFLDKNILLDRERRWWAIDPMPCVGDPCLDGAFWALHHRPGVGVRKRCALLAAAGGLDPDRVWRWALAFAATEAALDIGPGRADGHLRTLRA